MVSGLGSAAMSGFGGWRRGAWGVLGLVEGVGRVERGAGVVGRVWVDAWGWFRSREVAPVVLCLCSS